MSRFPDPEGDQLRHDLVLDDRWYQQREKEAGTLLTGIIHVFSLSIGYRSFFCRLFLVPLIIYALLLFVDAMFRNKCDLRVGSLSVIASFTQLFGYGTGFLRSII